MGKEKKNKVKETSERPKFNYRVLFRMYRVFGFLYKIYWKPIVASYIGMILLISVALLLPWPLKMILDYVILQYPLPPEAAFLTEWVGTESLSLLGALVGIYIVLYLLDSAFSYIYRYGFLIAGERMVAHIRFRIFKHLQGLSLSFHNTAKSGDLIYRLTYDIEHIKNVLVNFPTFFSYRMLMIGAHLVLMLMLEWRLALIAFSVVPIMYIYNQRFGADVEKATKKKRKKESSVSTIVTENVTSMALVQAYGLEKVLHERFAVQNRKSLKSGIKAMKLSKMFKRLNDILMAAGTGGVAIYGGILAYDAVILPGTLVLFVTYLRNLYKPIKKFADMMLDIAKSQVSSERLLELVDCNMVIEDSPDAQPLPPLKGDIEFRNVTFGYHAKQPVLKDISFRINAGETIALVGHSGAGKSTLINLIMRFYDPQKGEILVDGKPISKSTTRSLRDQMTVLMQSAPLFNKTVADNIAFGKVDASREDVIKAAKQAQAHAFISNMPEGYDTIISEGGENLSGGQRQRINIARAIIRNTPVVILDEPATALDAKAEALIGKAINKLTQGKTTLIIAHKFSTIAHADKILVLENGTLAGFGSHRELMNNCKAYIDLYNLQFGQHINTPEATVFSTNGGDGVTAESSENLQEKPAK